MNNPAERMQHAANKVGSGMLAVKSNGLGQRIGNSLQRTGREAGKLLSSMAGNAGNLNFAGKAQQTAKHSISPNHQKGKGFQAHPGKPRIASGNPLTLAKGLPNQHVR